jgi:hypothetical protein
MKFPRGIPLQVKIWAPVGLILAVSVFFVFGRSREPGRESGALRNERLGIKGQGDSFSVSDVPPVKEYLKGMKDKTNPLSGEAYTEEQIHRIHYLATVFPKNSLVPRPFPEFDEQLERRASAMNQIARDITSGMATPERVDEYFDYQERTLKERIEIAEFILKEDAWPAETKSQFKALSEQASRNMTRLHDDRKAVKHAMDKKTAALSQR